jgi:hypothetical protein
MKNSIDPTWTSGAALRLALLALTAILAGGVTTGCRPQGGQSPLFPQGPGSPQSPQSTQNNLVGQWRTGIQSGTLTLTIQANGQYMQMGMPQNGGTQTAQGGPYQLVAPNNIVFTVTDWSPKTRWIFVPNPRCGVPGVPNPTNPQRDSCLQWQEWTMPQPPGSEYAYVFNGPNAMTLTNQTGAINFTRAAAQ